MTDETLTFEKLNNLYKQLQPKIVPKLLILPARRNERGEYELLGLDAEILRFKAEQSLTRWQPSVWLDAGQAALIDTPLPFNFNR